MRHEQYLNHMRMAVLARQNPQFLMQKKILKSGYLLKVFPT